jgi:L-Ala-D/L-Glu epimerase
MSIVVSVQHFREQIMLREIFRTAIRETDRVEALRVLVTLDSGEIGRGYATATPLITGDTLESMEAFLDSEGSACVVGRSVNAELFQTLGTLTMQSPSGTAGLDLALHDLALHDLAVHDSAVHDSAGHDGSTLSTTSSVQCSVTVSAGSREEMVATVLRRLALGFRTIKLKLGVDPDGDADRLIAAYRCIAEHDGNVALWVDANQGWTKEQTLRIVDSALGAGVALARLEQPTIAHDIDALAYINARIPMPLVADESAKSVADIDRIASLGAAEIVNVKFMKFGGRTGTQIAVARARHHGLGVLLGSMMEHPHSVAAAVRFATTLTEPVHDLDAGWWASDSSPLTYRDGYVSVGPSTTFSDSGPKK